MVKMNKIDFKKMSDYWSNFYILMFMNIEINRLNKIIDVLINVILFRDYKKNKMKINKIIGNIK